MTNSLTVHQNLLALPVESVNEEVLRNLNAMFRDKEAFSEHTWKMLMSVCRSWAEWCSVKRLYLVPGAPEKCVTIYSDCRRAAWRLSR